MVNTDFEVARFVVFDAFHSYASSNMISFFQFEALFQIKDSLFPTGFRLERRSAQHIFSRSKAKLELKPDHNCMGLYGIHSTQFVLEGEINILLFEMLQAKLT
jgi:hypothetical protein